MGWSAAAVAASTVISAVASNAAAKTQAKAAEKAAQLSADATAASTAEQKKQFELSRADVAPYLKTGTNAMTQLAAIYGIGPEGTLTPEEMAAAGEGFTKTPGYEFRLGEGIKALDRSASARGKLLGGGYGKELTRYGQGAASDEFGSYVDRLAQLAGMGQNATTTNVNLGTNMANSLSNTLMAGANTQGNAAVNAGTARASGYAGGANAVSDSVQNYLLYNYLNKKKAA